MIHSKTVVAACAGILFSFGFNGFVTAAQTDSTKQSPAENLTGIVHFMDSSTKEVCTLAVPATTQVFDFSGNSHCENNKVAYFWFENVPSATLIHLYENAACSDAKTKGNYFIKLKTVKQPTTWSQTPERDKHISIDSLRDAKKGALLPGRYTRVEEDSWVGEDLEKENLNQRLSCVYIERSQPVN